MFYYNTDATDIVYFICASHIQDEAESRLGRKLTDDELHSVIKGVQWALDDALYEAYDTVFGNLPSMDNDYFYSDEDDEMQN